MMNDEEINALVKEMFNEALADADAAYAAVRPDVPAREGWACGPGGFIEAMSRCGISEGRAVGGRIGIFIPELRFMARFAAATGMVAACADLSLMTQNPMGSALLAGDPDALARELDGGADPNKHICGRPPLCIAASEACVRLLLERGAKAECKTADRVTALQCALFRGLQGGAALLMEKGADPYGLDTDDGAAVALAARFDSIGVLTDAGVNLNRLYLNCDPVAHAAFSVLDRESCLRLLEAGVEVAPKGCGDTLLHAAVEGGNMRAVELLLERGVDPDLRDPAGFTPLFFAVRFPDIVEMLIKGGADPNARNDEDETPLMHSSCRPESVRLLLAAGADVDAVDADGWTALHNAAVGGTPDDPDWLSCAASLESARILIGAGIDLDAVNLDGKTAEDIAEFDDNPECARLIREARKRRKGETHGNIDENNS